LHAWSHAQQCPYQQSYIHGTRRWAKLVCDLHTPSILLSASLNETLVTRGTPLPDSIPRRPDLILLADCIYFEPSFPLLVHTLNLLSEQYPLVDILMCSKKRRKVFVSFRCSTFHLLYMKHRPTNGSFLTWRNTFSGKRSAFLLPPVALLLI